MRRTFRVLLALALTVGAVVGGVGVASADPVRASASYTISGSVYLAPFFMGVPLDQVEVALYQSDGAGGWSRVNWTVPLNGEYQFNAPEGDYRIGVEPPASASSPLWRYSLPIYWPTNTSSVDSTMAMTLSLHENVEMPTFEVTENPRVTGTLTSAVDGSALTSAPVTLYWFSGPGPYRTDTVMTGPLGEYAIYVPRGEANSFSLGYAKTGYQTEFYVDKTRLEDADLRSAISWDGMDAALRARMTGGVVSSLSSFRGTGRTRITTTLRTVRSDGSIANKANAQFRLQRSYNNRTWTNIGGVLKTGSAGRHVALSNVSRTTYFRAVPVSSSKYYGVPSASVKVRKR